MDHQCSLCAHCGELVDLHDTFRDHCPDCGQPAKWVGDWIDGHERDQAVLARQEELE